MEQLKQKAKQLLENKKYKEAKQLMLQMIEHCDEDYQFFSDFGDISFKLNEFTEALNWYEKSVHINSVNSTIYIKIGNLLHEHLNDFIKAKRMYDNCLKLSPNNEECWLNYGNLLSKQNDFAKAEQCYLKCKTPHAEVKYRYGLMFCKKSPNIKQTQQKALHLLLEATELQPNIAKYHYQYALLAQKVGFHDKAKNAFDIALQLNHYQHALCSKDNGLFDQADKAFHDALKLENYKNINYLYDYAMFLWHTIKDYKNALKYLDMALNCTQHPNYALKYPSIQEAYDDLQDFIESLKVNQVEQEQHSDSNNNPNNNPNNNEEYIRLMIYEFDETITYWNLYTYIDGDINNLKHMRHSVLVDKIFGGYDRIDRLHIHFQHILSSQNKINLAILSFNDVNIIKLALQRVNLLQYFTDQHIIGNDTSKYLKQTRNKLKDIIELGNRYELNLITQVLLIDNNARNIELTKQYCITYHIFSDYILKGLSMYHMKEIEELIGVYVSDEYDIEPLSNKVSFINEINNTVYQAIKTQIAQANQDLVSFNSLPVIQYIKNNWKQYDYQKHFLYFAKMYQLILKYKPRNSFWSNANVLPKMRDMVTDCEIDKRYASCLSFLKHKQQAENIFTSIIHHDSDYIYHLDYGWFLLKCKRYQQAYDQFNIVFQNHMNECVNKARFYLGFAQVLQHIQEPTKAEKYYKLSLEAQKAMSDQYYQYSIHQNRNVIHAKFANFLYNEGRYEDSLYHYEYATYDGTAFADDHLALAKVLYKLEYFEDYAWNLKQALKLDKSLYEAKCALDEYENKKQKQFSVSDDQKMNGFNYKSNIIKCVYNVEFDTFWWDGINIIENEFNKYYDNFVNNNMNDIRYILFTVDEKIQSELKTKIKVSSLQNMQLIMTSIQDLRVQYQDFITTLKKYKMYKYYTIFTENAIYTIKSLVDKVTRENDLSKFVKCYNESNKGATKQFNQNDDNLIGLLSSFVIECKQLLD